MRRFFRKNSLSMVMFGLFFAFLAAQSVAGHREYNQDQREHGEPVISYVPYLGSGHFVEAVFENWESEFLQMGSFVLFTIFLRQKGSPESKKLEGKEPVDADPRDSRRRNAPWPVRRGGVALAIYEHSLTLALFLLFFVSLYLHAAGGVSEYNSEQLAHGGQAVSLLAYMGTSRFWFESFQNWQSEYMAVGALVVLSIFLRERGSPESKPVDHPHSETGSE
ncbi:MAG TPA: DUF6766 family protein [Actinomycetota bacterium]|jgi:hypothetical protein|nr:DUF6766 family protein [Actinomycetota bacterium]